MNKLTNGQLLQRLDPPKGKIRLVLDTDTYNEVDDQFALAYLLRSPEKIQLEAVYAAPFSNHRAADPGEGMALSYAEIIRILELMNTPSKNFVFRGATKYLEPNNPIQTEATEHLIQLAMQSPDEEPLYVLAIGAITNIATAILLEPEIVNKIVVVWLGGTALHWPNAAEFNLMQDIPAAQVLFDSGVPLVLVPCVGVTSHLHTTIPELDAHLGGKNQICDFLVNRVKEYHDDHFGWSKVIWDIAPVGWLLSSEWVATELVHSPIITDNLTWSVDHSRHFIRSAYYVNRDPIFRDMFSKLASIID